MFEPTYGGEGVERDGLYMLDPGSGTIRRCGLVGMGVALLEWVWPCWNGCGLVGVDVALLELLYHCWSGL